MAVNSITGENALNWFNHCGLFFAPILDSCFVVRLIAN
jgi:hypothetical protein